ncbi:MAG: ATP-binding protein, partial [Candidatus Bipolaricaulota bacterium]|nr:ATP-binding protein [Candidatus Bipolaricaulota bacterium]
EQARSVGLPLFKAYIPPYCGDDVYRERMKNACLKLLERGVEMLVFGDIFLEDVRRFREENLRAVGMKASFPLWGLPTDVLARRFIARGYRAKVVVVDLEKLPDTFAGREFDEGFLEDLPDGVDPCGENGEFHTFVYDGPCFSRPVGFRLGEKVVKDGRFCFVDLLPEI